MATTKPNVLIILADDVGVDAIRINPVTRDVYAQINALNNVVIGPRPLPNLKRLLLSGVNFNRACAQPVCSPTRASLFTGLQPWQTGVGFPEPVGNCVLPTTTSKNGVVLSLAEALKPAGYACGMFGKWHLGTPAPNQKRTPMEWGWDRFEGVYVGGLGPVIADYGYPRGKAMTLATLASPPPIGTRTQAEQNAFVTRAQTAATDCRNYLTKVCPDFIDSQPDIRFYVWEKRIEDKATSTRQIEPAGKREHMYATLDQISSARAWIKTQGSTPWCVALTLTTPHDPFHVPPKGSYTIRFANPQAPTMQEMFVAMIESMDYYIGQLLDSPDPDVQAQLKSTVILFAGDNGTADTDLEHRSLQMDDDLQDKGTQYIGGIHVPLIIADGGALYGGAPCYLKSAAGASQVNVTKSDIVHVTDVFKTVLEIAGAAPTIPGEELATKAFSLKPYLTGAAPSEKRAYNFSQQFPLNEVGDTAKLATIIDSEFKYKLACVRTAYVDGGASDQYAYELASLKPHPTIPSGMQEKAENLLDVRFVSKVMELYEEMRKHRLDDGDKRAGRAPLPFPPLPASITATKKIRLRSSKNDYLHRSDGAASVTTWDPSVGSAWFLENMSRGRVRLKSWKNDYLQRLDASTGVTTWSNSSGFDLLEWIVEPLENGKVRLKSWKGDYLNRSEQPRGVTIGSAGASSEWLIEVL